MWCEMIEVTVHAQTDTHNDGHRNCKTDLCKSQIFLGKNLIKNCHKRWHTGISKYMVITVNSQCTTSTAYKNKDSTIETSGCSIFSHFIVSNWQKTKLLAVVCCVSLEMEACECCEKCRLEKEARPSLKEKFQSWLIEGVVVVVCCKCMYPCSLWVTALLWCWDEQMSEGGDFPK